MKCNILVILSIFIISLFSCSSHNSDIVIYNAASTTDLVSEISELYKTESGISIKNNPAGSGTLIRQIEAGGRADLFLSASKEWVEYGYSKGLISEYAVIFSNRLVLIRNRNIKETEDFDLKGYKDYLSIGDPSYVPAGKYAKEYLSNIGLYTKLEEQIIPASDVRAALSVVELGEVDYGIVYYSDYLKSSRVELVEEISSELLDSSIDYYLALINDEDESVKELYDFLLQENRPSELYKKYGFGVGDD